MRGLLWSTALIGMVATAAVATAQSGVTVMDPERAVAAAASASPRGVSGTFGLTVRSVGVSRGRTYLNSEADYRDPRNISVVMATGIGDRLAKLEGGSLERLVGRRIVVRGDAQATRVDYIDRRGPTGKYYNQTQVRLYDLSRLTIEG